MSGAPVRFLVLLLGGWIGLRLIVVGAGFMDAGDDGEHAAHVATGEATRPSASNGAAGAPQRVEPLLKDSRLASASFNPHWQAGSRMRSARVAVRRRPAFGAARVRMASAHSRPAEARSLQPAIALPSEAQALAPPPFAGPFLRIDPSPTRRGRRWSGSAWLLGREGGGTALAPRGTLGGSQAGARLLYRLSRDAARPLSLSARFYSPLRQTRGAEAAAGIDWRPLAALPVHLLAERRQRLGREGRSAWSIAAYGGASVGLGRGFRLDGYAQAGIVGLRARDAFVDGAARLSAPLGPIEGGPAVWGAAQPGASRLDIGPHLTLPIRSGSANLRLSAEYRFRIIGDAQPDSGPALTLGVDF